MCAPVFSLRCDMSNRLADIDTKNPQSAIELLLTQPSLLDALRKAHMGNYGVILSLLGCLEHGVKSKKLVDKVIDVCESIHFYAHSCFANLVLQRRPCCELAGGNLLEQDTILAHDSCR